MTRLPADPSYFLDPRPKSDPLKAFAAASAATLEALILAKLNTAARSAVESDPVKKRFHDLSTVAPDANEHASEVLGQLVTRDVEKYRKLLEEKR